MSSPAAPSVTVAMVEQLARLAQLPLAEERAAIVAETLDGLLREANAVNRFMESAREVQPGVLYHHPAPAGRVDTEPAGRVA